MHGHDLNTVWFRLCHSQSQFKCFYSIFLINTSHCAFSVILFCILFTFLKSEASTRLEQSYMTFLHDFLTWLSLDCLTQWRETDPQCKALLLALCELAGTRVFFCPRAVFDVNMLKAWFSFVVIRLSTQPENTCWEVDKTVRCMRRRVNMVDERVKSKRNWAWPHWEMQYTAIIEYRIIVCAYSHVLTLFKQTVNCPPGSLCPPQCTGQISCCVCVCP